MKEKKKSVTSKLADLLNKESQRLGSKGFNEIGKDDNVNLPSLINNIIENMDTVKKEDDYYKYYYDVAENNFKFKDEVRKASGSKPKNHSVNEMKHAKTHKKLEKINEENNLCKFLFYLILY